MRLGLGLGFSGKKVTTFSDPNLSYTKLLMGMDSGVNTSQLFIDESPVARTGFTFSGAANISTDQAKFGPSSLELSADYVRWPDSDDWYFGTGEFTIETWVRSSDNTGVRVLVNQAKDLNEGAADSSWCLWTFNGTPYFSFYDPAASGWRDIAGTGVTTLSTWVHVAVDRGPDGKIRLYRDGVMVGSYTYTGEIRQVNQLLGIGGFGGSVINAFSGYLDEIRILKGKAAWASDGGFTPPTTAYARI